MRAVIVALALAACGGQQAASPPAGGSATRDEIDACTTAEDCTLVDACCGCNAGGKQIAIRKDFVAKFEASRPQRCGEQMCAQMISQDVSCDAEPICNSRGSCQVAPHMKHE